MSNQAPVFNHTIGSFGKASVGMAAGMRGSPEVYDVHAIGEAKLMKPTTMELLTTHFGLPILTYKRNR